MGVTLAVTVIVG